VKTKKRRRSLKPLSALNIRSIDHLARQLQTSAAELEKFSSVPDRFFERGFFVDKKGKERPKTTPRGRLYLILKRLNDLLQRLDLPPHIQGGRRGFSNLSNARIHLGRRVILKLDIRDFFPSITPRMVYAMFVKRCGCSPDVARVLTKITTIDGSLPQGTPSSTIISALVAENLSRRFQRLASQHDGRHSQFVDDTAVSGPDHLQKLKALAIRIIEQEGFRVHPGKVQVLDASEERVVTGVRVGGNVDVPAKKLAEVKEAIHRVSRRIGDREVIPERDIRSLEGRIEYVRRLNPGAGKYLSRQLRRLLPRTCRPC
jgi:RNA-directed DNA polymerase